MKKIISIAATAFVAVVMLASCQKQSQFVASSVSTQDYTIVDDSNINLNGTLVSKGSSPYDLGFVVASGHNPISSADVKSQGTVGLFCRAEQAEYSSGDKFKSALYLSPFIYSKGTYYYRALVIDMNPETGEYIYTYGEEKSFKVVEEK